MQNDAAVRRDQQHAAVLPFAEDGGLQPAALRGTKPRIPVFGISVCGLLRDRPHLFAPVRDRDMDDDAAHDGQRQQGEMSPISAIRPAMARNSRLRIVMRRLRTGIRIHIRSE